MSTIQPWDQYTFSECSKIYKYQLQHPKNEYTINKHINLVSMYFELSFFKTLETISNIVITVFQSLDYLTALKSSRNTAKQTFFYYTDKTGKDLTLLFASIIGIFAYGLANKLILCKGYKPTPPDKANKSHRLLPSYSPPSPITCKFKGQDVTVSKIIPRDKIFKDVEAWVLETAKDGACSLNAIAPEEVYKTGKLLSLRAPKARKRLCDLLLKSLGPNRGLSKGFLHSILRKQIHNYFITDYDKAPYHFRNMPIPSQSVSSSKSKAAPSKSKAASSKSKAAPVKSKAAPVKSKAAPVKSKAAPVKSKLPLKSAAPSFIYKLREKLASGDEHSIGCKILKKQIHLLNMEKRFGPSYLRRIERARRRNGHHNSKKASPVQKSQQSQQALEQQAKVEIEREVKVLSERLHRIEIRYENDPRIAEAYIKYLGTPGIQLSMIEMALVGHLFNKRIFIHRTDENGNSHSVPLERWLNFFRKVPSKVKEFNLNDPSTWGPTVKDPRKVVHLWHRGGASGGHYERLIFKRVQASLLPPPPKPKPSLPPPISSGPIASKGKKPSLK